MSKENIRNYLEQLKQLSKIVLKSDFSLFWQKVEVLKEHKVFYFEDEGNCYLNPYYNENFQGGLWRDDVYYFSFEAYFLKEAESEEGFNKLLEIDWTGESKEGEFAYFIQESLRCYGIKNFDITFWKDESKKILDKVEIKRGDYIFYQFEAFEKKLKEINFYLIFIDNSSDEYYPIIVNKEEYEILNEMSIGTLSIRRNK